MKAIRALVVLLLCGLSLLAFVPQNPIGPDGKPIPVAISLEPSHSLRFENDYARVLDVEIPPQKTTLIHRHDLDYVSVELADGQVEHAFDEFSLMTRTHQLGDVQFTHGPRVHQIRNPEGFATYHNVTVEIRKRSRQPYSYPYTGESVANYNMLPLPVEPGKTFLVSLDRDTVRISGVQILPGESETVRTGRQPILVVAVSDLDLSATVKGEKRDVKVGRGDTGWDPPEFREKLTNTGREPARFVVMEFK
jgi:hypothetical protein